MKRYWHLSDMRTIPTVLLKAALALPVICQSHDLEPRLGSLIQARTPEGFYRDALTMTYWHMMSIRCPFEKHDVDDLDFLAMTMFMADDAPRISPELQARLDREGESMVERALGGDHASVCHAALAAMRADANTRMAEVEDKDRAEEEDKDRKRRAP